MTGNDDTRDEAPPEFPPPGMQALLEEYRRKYPAFRTGVVPGVEPPDPSAHPLLDALLAEYRERGLL